MLVELLEVDLEDALDEFEKCRGPHVRYSWLLKIVKNHMADNKFIPAARAYMLHLVGMTLFCDKSNMYVDVAYLELFRDARTFGQYAWGAAGLAFLYGHLGHASKKRAKSIAGYLSLLQV